MSLASAGEELCPARSQCPLAALSYSLAMQKRLFALKRLRSPFGAPEGKMVEICDLGFVLIVPLKPADLGAAVRLQDAP